VGGVVWMFDNNPEKFSTNFRLFTPTRMEVVTIQLVIETISFASSYMHVLFAFLRDHAAHELITVLNTVASIWKSKNYWRKFDSKSMKTTASEY